jgi:hypothetical protein
MKNLILTFGLTALMITAVQSQNCSLFEEGMIMKTQANGYMATVQYTPDWLKLKDVKKEEKIIAFNNSVLSGTEVPTSAGTYDFKISKVTRDSEGDRVLVEADINGYHYSTVLACKGDVMYFARNADPIWAIDNGDTVGFTLQGIQEIPNKLKVGDVLKPYDDVQFTLPKKTDIVKQWPEFQGYEVSYHTETGLGYDVKNSEWAYGDWEVKTTKAIYENVPVKGKEVLKAQYNVKHYLNAVVTRTEDVKINDKTYTAFVIESETWTKFKIDISYDMENKACEAYYNSINSTANAIGAKKNVKAGIENEQGYSVTYLTEWFVPGIGVVKSLGYDKNGFINVISSTLSLQ